MSESKDKTRCKIKLGKTYRRKDMPHVWIRVDQFWRDTCVEGLTHEGYRHIVPISVIEEHFEECDVEPGG